MADQNSNDEHVALVCQVKSLNPDLQTVFMGHPDASKAACRLSPALRYTGHSHGRFIRLAAYLQHTLTSFPRNAIPTSGEAPFCRSTVTYSRFCACSRASCALASSRSFFEGLFQLDDEIPLSGDRGA